MINVRDFGANGDGTDQTQAIQQAIDAGSAKREPIYLPSGLYCVGQLEMKPFTRMVGEAWFTYRSAGGTVLRLNDPDATTMINLRDTIGVSLESLILDGGAIGENITGILKDIPEQIPEEETLLIDRCQVRNFSGDGINTGFVFVITIRHSHVIHNGGHGVRIRGADGFVIDSWISCNGGAGFAGIGDNLSFTLTGNRVEWNRIAGLLCCGPTHYNITGNYIDRNGGSGIDIRSREDAKATVMTITGNVIYRSARPNWVQPGSAINVANQIPMPRICEEQKLEMDPAFTPRPKFVDVGIEPGPSAQISVVDAAGIVITGNTLCAGRDDHKQGEFSPDYGIVCEKLSDTVITNNVMYNGAMKQLIDDRGNHGEGVIIKDNPGRLFDGSTITTFNV